MILNEFRTFVGDMKKVAEEIIPKLELESIWKARELLACSCSNTLRVSSVSYGRSDSGSVLSWAAAAAICLNIYLIKNRALLSYAKTR